MRLSIIIPIFNVEDTLQRCLESVLTQADERMEVVLIDDGSTDSSGRIAEEMTADKGNCRLIHQTNKGLSAARNAGIEVATGDYLTFVDSDDFVAEGTMRCWLCCQHIPTMTSLNILLCCITEVRQSNAC